MSIEWNCYSIEKSWATRLQSSLLLHTYNLLKSVNTNRRFFIFTFSVNWTCDIVIIVVYSMYVDIFSWYTDTNVNRGLFICHFKSASSSPVWKLKIYIYMFHLCSIQHTRHISCAFLQQMENSTKMEATFFKILADGKFHY